MNANAAANKITAGHIIAEQKKLILKAAWKLSRESTNSQILLLKDPQDWLKIDGIRQLDSLVEALINNEDKLFFSDMNWSRVRFESQGVGIDSMITGLEYLRKALVHLADSSQIKPAIEHIDLAISQLQLSAQRAGSIINPASPYRDVCNKYIDLLLSGDRGVASKLIIDIFEDNTPLKDIYMEIFQPALHEVGRRWQIGQLTVAQEHFFTAATQMIMSQLYPYLFIPSQKDKVFVSACVSGELHEVGIRMVTDLMEMDGWQTYYLGASTPVNDLVTFAADKHADVIGLSVTLTQNLPRLRELIKAIRSNTATKNIKLLLGGHPMTVSKDLWKSLGSDGYAYSAADAVVLANKLTGR